MINNLWDSTIKRNAFGGAAGASAVDEVDVNRIFIKIYPKTLINIAMDEEADWTPSK